MKTILFLLACMVSLVSCNNNGKSFSEQLRDDSTRVKEFMAVADSLQLCAEKQDTANFTGEEVPESDLPILDSILEQVKYDRKHRPVVKFSARKLKAFIGNDLNNEDTILFYVGTLKGRLITRYINRYPNDKLDSVDLLNRPILFVRRDYVSKEEPGAGDGFARKVFDFSKICPPPPDCRN